LVSFRIDADSPFRLAIDASPTGIVVVDSSGAIVLVNQEFERQFGYAPQELVGRPAGLVVPEGLAWPGLRATHLIGRRKDGSPMPVEVRTNPIETPEGRFTLASVVNLAEWSRVSDERRLAIEEQLEFQRFVAELSSHFINLPAERIDEAIRAGLGRLCEQLALDRAALYRVGADGTLDGCIGWTAAGVPAIEGPFPARERLPWALERILAGHTVLFSTLEDVPSQIDRASYAAFGIRSAVIIPLSVDGRVEGALSFNTVHAERHWQGDVLHRLTIVASVFHQVLARRQREDSLQRAVAEVERLKNDLQTENVHLRREVRESMGLAGIVGQSASIQRVVEQIHQVATTDSTVLLLGETGTGKELFAAQIHELGSRRSRAMVRVNCAAIPATLIESELFGREKGAYTGALARQAGRFELADRSTIFLDEIGDLPPEVQVKLLRVIEERQIERLGSPKPIAVDTRIIAATHRNLEERIKEGSFREDLYYRLNVFPIRVPPLRERVEDIPLLVWLFVEEFSKTFGKRIDTIGKENLAALQHYSWPGNIRELRNVVERAMISVSGPRLTIALPAGSAAAAKRSSKLVDVEREHIRAVLQRTGWRVRGSGGAADALGLKPTTLETRLAKLGLRRPGHA
jgi:transcriptional regulator with GAF, ATPase, and Fis domain